MRTRTISVSRRLRFHPAPSSSAGCSSCRTRLGHRGECRTFGPVALPYRVRAQHKPYMSQAVGGAVHTPDGSTTRPSQQRLPGRALRPLRLRIPVSVSPISAHAGRCGCLWPNCFFASAEAEEERVTLPISTPSTRRLQENDVVVPGATGTSFEGAVTGASLATIVPLLPLLWRIGGAAACVEVRNCGRGQP